MFNPIPPSPKEPDMNTTTNTRGVEIPGLIEMSDLLRKRGVETRSYRDHEIAEAAFRAALEAALPPEPAAQGDGWDARGGSLWLDREQWGTVIDALIENRASAAKRKNMNPDSTSDVRADECGDLIGKITRAAESLTAPPAQLPEGWERDAVRYRVIRDAQATIIYKRKGHGVWEPLVDTRETSTRCASLDEAIDRAMLTASGAPDKKKVGLYQKFNVTRTDGSSSPGGKHHGCEYFVLDMTHDPFALPAIRAYANACADQYPMLADDLRTRYGTTAGGKGVEAVSHYVPPKPCTCLTLKQREYCADRHVCSSVVTQSSTGAAR